MKTKIKIFSNYRFNDLEKEVNDWIELNILNNFNYTISHSSTTFKDQETGDIYTKMIIIINY